uniref:Adenylate cyclase N-terminal domain-containing protein n=1 Tax=Heliothis virescens TaxID=7102 RepID=A0A2A4K905_HELVI
MFSETVKGNSKGATPNYCKSLSGSIVGHCEGSVEMLYQRYFLRMNQTNMTHLLGLLLAVAVGLMAVQIQTLLVAQGLLSQAETLNDTYMDNFNRDSLHDPHRYLNITTSRYHEALAAINATQHERLVYEKERVAHIVNIIILGITALVYAFAEHQHGRMRSADVRERTRRCRWRLHEATWEACAPRIVNIGAHLMLDYAADQIYCSVATLIACNLAGIMTHNPRELAQRRAFLETRDCVEARLVTQRENTQQCILLRSSLSISTGACALLTYATYATLPVRLHEATVGGLALGIVNIGAHLMLDYAADVNQIYCSVATLIACNLAGIMTHNPRELAQRRAFLETRDCVEARLVTQRENTQQERLLLSVLPRHVAMEMKADIANQPRQEQFHKIYIQRYENVRYVLLTKINELVAKL